MILGTKSRYAVMAMADLANHATEKPVKLAEIAARQEIPLNYLEQIFSLLRQHNLVKSVKGPGGGYLLARSIDTLPLSEIVLAAEEEIRMTRCDTASKTGCIKSKEQCLTHDVWEGLSNKIIHYFNAITLEDVCKRRLRTQNQGTPAFMPDTANQIQPLLPMGR